MYWTKKKKWKHGNACGFFISSVVVTVYSIWQQPHILLLVQNVTVALCWWHSFLRGFWRQGAKAGGRVWEDMSKKEIKSKCRKEQSDESSKKLG